METEETDGRDRQRRRGRSFRGNMKSLVRKLRRGISREKKSKGKPANPGLRVSLIRERILHIIRINRYQ